LSNEPKGTSPSQAVPPSPTSATAVANPPARPSAAHLNKHDELRLLVNSRHPIITVETPEEERLEQLLFDIANELKYEVKGQTYTTPAVSILMGLRESLKILRDEGLSHVFARHARIARGVRSAVTSLELELFADPMFFSNTVTAVRAPRGDEDLNKKLIGTLRDKFGLELAGGQGPLTGKIFRIGHLGDVSEDDALEIIDRLEQGLIEIGYIDGKVGALDALTSAMREQPAASPA